MSDPLLEGRVVYVPTWTCPKCGAVCDVSFLAALSPQEREHLEERQAYYDLAPAEREKHRLHLEMTSGFDCFFQDTIWRRDLPPEGRLQIRCTRCKHTYQERPLDTR